MCSFNFSIIFTHGVLNKIICSATSTFLKCVHSTTKSDSIEEINE